MNKEEIKLYSWVIRGKQRVEIIKVMGKRLTLTQVKKLSGIALNNDGDILKLFVKKKIARCLNEREKLGRIYVLTKSVKRLEIVLKTNITHTHTSIFLHVRSNI